MQQKQWIQAEYFKAEHIMPSHVFVVRQRQASIFHYIVGLFEPQLFHHIIASC